MGYFFHQLYSSCVKLSLILDLDYLRYILSVVIIANKIIVGKGAISFPTDLYGTFDTVAELLLRIDQSVRKRTIDSVYWMSLVTSCKL